MSDVSGEQIARERNAELIRALRVDTEGKDHYFYLWGRWYVWARSVDRVFKFGPGDKPWTGRHGVTLCHENSSAHNMWRFMTRQRQDRRKTA